MDTNGINENARDERPGSAGANAGSVNAHANACGARPEDHVNRARAGDARRGDACGNEPAARAGAHAHVARSDAAIRRSPSIRPRQRSE